MFHPLALEAYVRSRQEQYQRDAALARLRGLAPADHTRYRAAGAGIVRLAALARQAVSSFAPLLWLRFSPAGVRDPCCAPCR